MCGWQTHNRGYANTYSYLCFTPHLCTFHQSICRSSTRYWYLYMCNSTASFYMCMYTCVICVIYIYIYVVNVLLLRLQPGTAQTRPFRQPSRALLPQDLHKRQGFQPVLRSAGLSASAQPCRPGSPSRWDGREPIRTRRRPSTISNQLVWRYPRTKHAIEIRAEDKTKCSFSIVMNG